MELLQERYEKATKEEKLIIRGIVLGEQLAKKTLPEEILKSLLNMSIRQILEDET